MWSTAYNWIIKIEKRINLKIINPIATCRLIINFWVKIMTKLSKHLFYKPYPNMLGNNNEYFRFPIQKSSCFKLCIYNAWWQTAWFYNSHFGSFNLISSFLSGCNCQSHQDKQNLSFLPFFTPQILAGSGMSYLKKKIMNEGRGRGGSYCRTVVVF